MFSIVELAAWRALGRSILSETIGAAKLVFVHLYGGINSNQYLDYQ